MKPLNDLIMSAIVAVLAWFAYDKLGLFPALGVLVVATLGFVWWNSRRASDDK